MDVSINSPQAGLPFVIGVTGHRDINDSNGESLNTNLKRDIHQALTYWRELLGEETPIWLLSGLAAGADLLAVEVALELQEEWGEGSLHIIACLPMPLINYEHDFDGLDYAPQALEQLKQTIATLDKSSNDTLVVRHNLNDQDYQCAINDYNYGELRNSLYLNQGLFVAKYSNVLLSLWDGNAALGCGGTADVVKYKLGASVNWPAGTENPSLKPISDFDGQTAGLVHHIPTARLKVSATNKPISAIDSFTPSGSIEGKELPVGQLFACLNLDEAQNTLLADFISLEFAKLTEELALYNKSAVNFSVETYSAPETGLSASQRIFEVADALAMTAQMKYRKIIITFFLFAIPGFACYELAGNLVNSEVGSRVFFLTLLAIFSCWGLIQYAAKKDLKWEYQRARGVAEGMRIRGFLNVANVPPSSAPLIPRRFRCHLPLLNHAVAVAEMDGWRTQFDFEQQRVEQTWLSDQRSFLQSRLQLKANTISDFLYKRPLLAANTIGYWAKVCFRVAIVLGVLLLILMVTQQILHHSHFSEINNGLMLALQYSLMLGGVIALWSELAGYESTARGYESLDQLYERAQSLLYGEFTHSKRLMLQELAREAMFEHVSWTNSEMSNDLKQKN